MAWCAENEDEVKEVAQYVYDMDARTRLDSGLVVLDYEVEELE